MASGRINCFVTAKYPDLRDHLRQYDRAAGERLKLLATVGAIMSAMNQNLSPADPQANDLDDQVLRVNVRLSPAFEELLGELGNATKKGGKLIRLAALGLEITRNPLAHDLLYRAAEATESVDVGAKEKDSKAATNDTDWMGLAGGLLDDDAIWR
ncbi:hypothetical protein [Marinobacter sp. F3R08]|uniref:hypothetical protein n=1 Tax=Marinobacter sp. F3R08 TaxID=2841559 RepID=UPI001C082C99|nr:hypothetical protein [Marinobacter sp. F3R08]MBU2952172.1 hypothetical protein [Marinobacter sp. F3R08]